MLRIALIVNPIAGIGGPAALKGSDDEDVQRRALGRGVKPAAAARARRTFALLDDLVAEVELLVWGGAMGADAVNGLGFRTTVLGTPPSPSSAADTREAARRFAQAGCDVVVFAGGDGTARDLVDSLPEGIAVLGIPAGVKMHSGVFAVTPDGAAEVLRRWIRGALVAVVEAEVRDVDEAALARGELATRHYGELETLREGGYLQHVKTGGRESEELVREEIAAYVAELAGERDDTFLLGPGSTLAAIKSRLGMTPTLLGFDVYRQGETLHTDADRQVLKGSLRPGATVVVLSFTRHQGFLLGRGNQQLDPRWLLSLGRERLWVVGSRTKLATLEGRPLLVDSASVDVDRALAGSIEIIAGYEDRLFYRVDWHD